MVKQITTKKELKDFQDYLTTAPKHLNLSNFYKRSYSTAKQKAWESIIKECVSNRGICPTVIRTSSMWFTTGYIICASDTEWYFVCHRPTFRYEYKLTAEQIKEAKKMIEVCHSYHT